MILQVLNYDNEMVYISRATYPDKVKVKIEERRLETLQAIQDNTEAPQPEAHACGPSSGPSSGPSAAPGLSPSPSTLLLLLFALP